MMTNMSSFMPGWYAVLPSQAVKKKNLVAVRRFNLNIVFGVQRITLFRFF